MLAASSWGSSDFVGGLGARRAPALLVVASGHAFTLIVLLAICLGMRLAVPGLGPFLYSAIGGLEGAFALALFYRALAMGVMGLTAALCGLLTALVPVLFSMIHDGLPTPLVAGGLVLGLCAIWLITRTPNAGEGLTGDKSVAPTSRSAVVWASWPARRFRQRGRPQHDPSGDRRYPDSPSTKHVSDAALAPASRTPLLMGALAGIGFGSQLILLKMAGTVSIFWIMTFARAAGVLGLVGVLLIVSRMGARIGPLKELRTGPRSGFLSFGILAGSLDTLGNLFYILATRLGRLDVAALVSSLYPGGTILLAMLVLGEKPGRQQVAGIALALAAVALLSI
jgi:drug/metabolite transporter (DMT)-like permease